MNFKHKRKAFFSLLLVLLVTAVFMIPAYADTQATNSAPSITEINQYLIIGMKPSAAGEAVTIGSSNELGADRQTLSGGTPSGNPDTNRISPLTPSISPADPDPYSPNLRDVFFKDPSAPSDPSKNRWLWDNAADAHYLPGPSGSKLFLFRGVDWSGDVAVTSATGTFSLQDINVFGQFGFRATSTTAPVNISNSYYFDDPSLTGVLMDPIEGGGADQPTRGWDGGYNHTQLLTDLRLWRTYIRDLPRDTFFNSGDGSNPRDLVNRNSIDNNAGGKFMYDVAGLDSNNDGIVVVDIAFDGTDFEVNNSDWVIYNSDTANPKFVIFRVRGRANMNMSNASIMVGEGIVCNANGMGVLFVKAHPEEEFTSTSGSSDAVFSANNLVVSKVGFWDLNTIGNANTDTDYGPPSDSSVYLSGSGGMPTQDYVNRNQQNNYTTLRVENGQGCSQFISPEIRFNNVRWIKCGQCQAAQLDYGDAPDTSAGTGIGNYNTTAADNGPSHVIVPDLHLGVTPPDADDGTLQNAAATADDLDNIDDEDGISTLPTILTTSTSVSLGVSYTNASGSNATLACWIDFNRDGDFTDAGERASTTVTSSGTNPRTTTLTFSGFATPAAGDSYIRCRIANAAGEVADPTGPANTGEVEDYRVEILRPGAIGNYVWVDENSDGFQDAGEPGLPNVRVDLKDCTTGAILATTYTDAQGGYLFDNLAPGTYCVDVDESTLPPGMTQTPLNLPGADFGNQNHGGNGYQVVLPAGGENLTADFGYNYNPTDDVDNGKNTAALGDRIWVDADGDGVQDPEEPGIPGVCVELFTAGPDGLFGTADDVSLGTTTTDDNGYYLFDGLAPDAYVVKLCPSNFQPGGPLEGYTQTGDPDDFGQPAQNPDNQTTTPVILAPGDVFLNADFGYQPPAGQNNSIGDKVWFDADADGVGPNGNGAAPGNDNTETGIPGVTVALIRDANNNGVWDLGEPIIATTVTDANGDYLFTGLPDGSYLVWVNDTDNVLGDKVPTYDKDGGVASSGSGAPIGVASSTVLGLSSSLNLGVGNPNPASDLTQDFGYTAPGQTPVTGLIGDRVWLDINNDGVQDPNEPGLEGVTVTLKDNLGNTIAVTTTDENGNYYFGGLPAGTYTVVVTPPAGLTQTYDADGLGTPHQSTVTIGPGEVNLLQDFGYVGDGTIGNLVWEDLNADGDVDPGEPGIGGVTLDLYWDLNGNGRVDPGEPLVGSTTTAPDGSYLFTGLPVDDGGGNAQFVVVVTDENGVLGGYWHSLGTPGQDNNSQTDPYAVTLTPAAPTNLTADFGYYVKAAALGNFVWNDLNGNGIQDAGEPGIDGVKVTLTAKYVGGVSYTFSTVTGDDPSTPAVEQGWYSFGNLLLDEDHASSKTGAPTAAQPVYTISVATPAGYAPTLVDQGGNDMVDSDNHAGVDGLATQGQTDVTQKADPNAETNPIAGYDFGYQKVTLGAIGNYVWVDENSDGYQDAGEPGLPNVVVVLYDAQGNEAARTVTDSNGGYLFNNLLPGTYYVDVLDGTGNQPYSLPFPNMTQTPPSTLPGADFGNQNHGATPIPNTSFTGYPVTIGSGEENLTADFGYNYNPADDVNDGTGTAAIGDRVWIDANGDGFQNPEEVGLPGVCVELVGAGPDGLFGTADDVVLATTTTNAAGYYIFDGLTPGAYVVRMCASNFEPGGPLDGYTQTGDPDDFGQPAQNPDDQTTTPVILAPGDVFLNADFGYQPPASQNNTVGDRVWFDANADGVQDAGEPGIPGVTVALIQDTNGNGIWDLGEPIIAATITDENGEYLFTGVPDGDYLVWVNDIDNVLGDKVQTYDSDGVNTPNISAVALDPNGTNPNPVVNLDQDFGYTAPGQTPVTGLIGDRVWLDINSDGVQDPNEPGLEGVTVTLKDNLGNTIAVTTTDENGNYYFGGLPAGTYTVVVTPPAGLTQTYDADGLGTPHQSTVTIGPGGVNLLQDFGYVGDGTIGNLVWEDLNADGDVDPGEPGIGGVTLDLYWDLNGNGRVDPGEPLVGSTTTAPDGSYLFTGLPVDDGGGNAQFVVVVTDENGVLGGYWHSLGTPGQDNNSQTDPYAVTLTPAAPTNLTADFGYYVKAAALGNFVWADLNGNGIQDAGEPGLDGVEVTLTVKYANGVTYTLSTLTGDDPSTPAVEQGWYSFGNLLLDEDHASSKTGAPTAAQPVYTISATSPAGYAPTLLNQGSNDMVDADDPNGVDGLATQGQTDVTQKADPNTETNPIAGYDFGYQPLDFGDLPDSYGTTLAANGARHTVTPALFMGVCVDAEMNGQPTVNALGDDNNGGLFSFGACAQPGDDEDGVYFPNITADGPARSNWSDGTGHMDVTVTGGDACLNAWVDFGNGVGLGPNGQFDANEHVVVNLAVAAGLNPIDFALPLNAADDANLAIRVRLTPRDANGGCGAAEAYAGGAASPTGLALGGEVEDYWLDDFTPTAISLQAVTAAQAGDVAWIVTSMLILLSLATYRIMRRRREEMLI